MLCPELFSKNLLVLGLRKIIIKVVVEASRPVGAEGLCGFGVVHFASNLSNCHVPENISVSD